MIFIRGEENILNQGQEKLAIIRQNVKEKTLKLTSHGTFHVKIEVRYRDPITRSGQLGLRENQLDHSSAGMCYRTRVGCVDGTRCTNPITHQTLDLSQVRVCYRTWDATRSSRKLHECVD